MVHRSWMDAMSASVGGRRHTRRVEISLHPLSDLSFSLDRALGRRATPPGSREARHYFAIDIAASCGTTTTISTRRFFFLPESDLLSATGSCSPRDALISRVGSMARSLSM